MNIEIKKQESAVSYDFSVSLRLRSRSHFDAIVNWCKETTGYCNHQSCIPYNNYYWRVEMQASRLYEGLPIAFSFDTELDAVAFKLRFSEYL